MTVLLVATFNVKPDRFGDFQAFFSDFKNGYAQQDERLQNFRMFRKSIAAEQTGEVLSVEEFATMTDCASYMQDMEASPEIAEDDEEWQEKQMTTGNTAFEIWTDRTPTGTQPASSANTATTWSIHTVRPLSGKTGSMLRFFADLQPIQKRAGGYGSQLYQATVAGPNTGAYHAVEEYDDLAHYQSVMNALETDPDAAAYMEHWIADRPLDGPVNATILTEILL